MATRDAPRPAGRRRFVARPLLARAAALPRPRLRRHHRLHRPRQLGDQHRRRQPVRLHAALGHLAEHADAHLPAAHGGAARHRHRQVAGGRTSAATSRDRVVWLLGLTIVPALRRHEPGRDPRRRARASRSCSTSRCGSARRSRWRSSCSPSSASATTSSSDSSSCFLAFIAVAYVVELFIVKPDMAAAVPHWLIPSVSGGEHRRRHGHAGRHRHAAQHLPALRHHPVARVGLWAGRARRGSCAIELIDTTLSMGMGWLVNSAMILVAAAVFLRQRHHGDQHPAGVADAGSPWPASRPSSSSAWPCSSPVSPRRSPRRWPRPTW